MTPDPAAESMVSVPGVVAEYFNFDEHVLGRTSLPDMLQYYHRWWLTQAARSPRPYAREQSLLQRLAAEG